jgi:hypothetical protein
MGGFLSILFRNYKSIIGAQMKKVALFFAPAILLFSMTLAVGNAGITRVTAQSKTKDKKIFLPMMVTPCYPDVIPTGALSNQPRAVFCNIKNQGPDTSQETTNAWLDNFDHHLSFASFDGTHYKIFDTVGFIYQTIHWRHADHWMVDLATKFPEYPPDWVRGGGLMRPDRTFRFENGRLVVEVDVAAGMDVYGGSAWPEIVITTGDRPHDNGSLYAYDLFPEDWTLGCRLQDSRYPVCALKSDDGSIEEGSGSKRIWEMSQWQPVGTDDYGGSPFEGRENYWRECSPADADINCRDRFRLELTQTSLGLYVNGHRYFEQKGIPPLPQELLSGDLYVYFASMVVSHPAEAIRFHWDRISINPHSTFSAQERFVPKSIQIGGKDWSSRILK